jgi:hypothetical protein
MKELSSLQTKGTADTFFAVVVFVALMVLFTGKGDYECLTDF